MGAALEDFILAYFECALWAETDNSTEQGGDPLDENYTYADFSDEAIARMRQDCKRFFYANEKDIELGSDGPDYSRYTRAGRDFWLTRRGHGSGYWDGDWEPEKLEERLTKAAHAFGDCDIYVGDDGKLHIL